MAFQPISHQTVNLTDDDIDEYVLFLIAQDLADGLKKEVDLVDLK